MGQKGKKQKCFMGQSSSTNCLYGEIIPERKVSEMPGSSSGWTNKSASGVYKYRRCQSGACL